MTPDDAAMIRGLLLTSAGSPGYGATTLTRVGIEGEFLVLDLVEAAGGRRYLLRAPYQRLSMMDGLTFADDPAQFGSLLALHLDEEICTGLLSQATEGVDPADNGPPPLTLTLDPDA